MVALRWLTPTEIFAPATSSIIRGGGDPGYMGALIFSGEGQSKTVSNLRMVMIYTYMWGLKYKVPTYGVNNGYYKI